MHIKICNYCCCIVTRINSHPQLSKSECLNYRLRELYSNDEIADKIPMDPGNLSSYVSGNKTPGAEFIDKFYSVFQEDLTKLGYDHPGDDDLLTEVNEEQLALMQRNRRVLIDELKVQNEFLRSNFGKIVETNQTMAESNNRMSQSNLILAETNQKLANPKGL